MEFLPSSSSPTDKNAFYRTGKLTIHNKSHTTPICSIHTRRGTIPHLTNDNFKLVLDACGMNSAIIQLNLFDLMHNYPLSIFSGNNNDENADDESMMNEPQATNETTSTTITTTTTTTTTTTNKKTTLHKFFNFDSYSLMLSIRDAQYPTNTQLFNDKGIMGDTESGRKKLSDSEFISAVEQLGSDFHVMMHDNGYGNGNGEPLINAYNKKRFAKAIQRNNNWYKKQQEQVNENEKKNHSSSIPIHGLMQCTASLEHHASHLPLAIDSMLLLTTSNKSSQQQQQNEANNAGHSDGTSETQNNNNIRAVLFGDLTQMSPHDQSIALSNSVRMVHERIETRNNLSGGVLRVIQGMDHPLEVLECVYRGMDLFDATYPFVCSELGYASVYPLLPSSSSPSKDVAATAALSSDIMKLNLRSVEYVRDFTPISNTCPCWACKNHTRAYIHHLLNTHEMLAEVLLTMHNLYHYLSLFQTIQQQISNCTFEEYKTQMEQIWRKI